MKSQPRQFDPANWVMAILVGLAAIMGISAAVAATWFDWDRTLYEGEVQFGTLHELEEFVLVMDKLDNDVEDISVNSPLTVEYYFFEQDPVDWPYGEGVPDPTQWSWMFLSPLLALAVGMLAFVVLMFTISVPWALWHWARGTLND